MYNTYIAAIIRDKVQFKSFSFFYALNSKSFLQAYFSPLNCTVSQNWIEIKTQKWLFGAVTTFAICSLWKNKQKSTNLKADILCILRVGACDGNHFNCFALHWKLFGFEVGGRGGGKKARNCALCYLFRSILWQEEKLGYNLTFNITRHQSIYLSKNQNNIFFISFLVMFWCFFCYRTSK